MLQCPKDTPWRSAIAKKSAENTTIIAPQIADDVAAWVPEDAIVLSDAYPLSRLKE